MKTETYEQMIAQRAEINAYYDALGTVNRIINRSCELGNRKLDAMINDLRHLCNDQLIELKYGKGYKASFLDEILIQASNL